METNRPDFYVEGERYSILAFNGEIRPQIRLAYVTGAKRGYSLAEERIKHLERENEELKVGRFCTCPPESKHGETSAMHVTIVVKLNSLKRG